jgi:hypothetical protein
VIPDEMAKTLTPINNQPSWKSRSQSYRCGYIEGQSGVRDVYLLQAGCTNLSEYERGFADGLASVREVT